MRVRERLDLLSQRVARAERPASLRRIVAEMLQLEADWGEGDDLDELRLQAFESLTRFTDQDWEAARDALLNDWLHRFPSPAGFLAREALLTRLVDALDGSTVERACRLIGMVGYRDERA